MRRYWKILSAGAFALLGLTCVANAAPACDPGNGGITLPTGFCALVAADNIGTARQIAVAPNGDVYVAIQSRGAGGGVVALRDTKGDGHFDVKRHLATAHHGIGLYNGYLYVAQTDRLVRWKMTPGN